MSKLFYKFNNSFLADDPSTSFFTFSKSWTQFVISFYKASDWCQASFNKFSLDLRQKHNFHPNLIFHEICLPEISISVCLQIFSRYQFKSRHLLQFNLTSFQRLFNSAAQNVCTSCCTVLGAESCSQNLLFAHESVKHHHAINSLHTTCSTRGEGKEAM